MATTVPTSIVLPSDDKSRKEIMGAVKEISVALTHIDGQKEQIKTIVEDIALGYKSNGITKAMINKIARIYHKQNKDVTFGQNEDLETLYETIFPASE